MQCPARGGSYAVSAQMSEKFSWGARVDSFGGHPPQADHPPSALIASWIWSVRRADSTWRFSTILPL